MWIVENATNIEYWQPSVSKKSSCSTSLDCSAHVYCFFSPFTPLNPCRWLNVLQPPPLNHVFALLIRSTIKCTGRRDHWSCKYMSIPARIHVNAAQFSRFITMRQIHADALHWPHPLCSSSHTHTHTLERRMARRRRSREEKRVQSHLTFSFPWPFPKSTKQNEGGTKR